MKKILLTLALVLLFSPLTSGEELLKVKWEHTIGQAVNGLQVRDFNEDGKKEVAAIASQGGEIFFINSTGNRTGREGVSCVIYDLNSAQMETKKILVGACTHFHVFNYSGGQEWQYFTEHAPVRLIFPIDINEDGKEEILVGVGKPSSSRKNNLYLIDQDRKTHWKKGLPYAPCCMDVKDIDADGAKEIVVGTRSSTARAGALRGRIVVYDEEGNLEWETPLKRGVYSVKIDDLDEDGSWEIIGGSFRKVYVLDKNGEKKWNYDTGGYVYSLGVMEVEGRKKLMVGTNDLLVFDSDLNLEWEYNTEDEIYTLQSGDLDMDGIPEIIAGSNKLYVFNHEGKLLWNSKSFLGVKGLSWADLEGDGYKEIVVGALDGKIYVFETRPYVLQEKAQQKLAQAQELYQDKKYQEALSYVQEAKKLYQNLNQSPKIRECQDLITEFNATLAEDTRNKKEAQEYWNKSLNFYVKDDFKTALAYAKKAKLYLEAVKRKDSEVKELLEKCNSLINNSLAGLKMRAQSYSENASQLYESGDYPSALESAQEAKLIYVQIEDSSKINKSKELMAEILYNLAEEEYYQNKLENATQHVERALEIYTNLDNETYPEEIQQCQDLAQKIEKGPTNILQNLSSTLQKNLVWILGVGILILLILIIRWSLPLLRERRPPKRTQEPEPPKKVVEEQPPEPEEKPEEEEKEEKKKPKSPLLEPIAKDKFEGTGKSLRV